MEAKELMIGNWIFDCESYQQVTGIHENKVYNKYGWCLISEVNGIELTPEILEKAGFVKDNYGTYFIPDTIYFCGFRFGELQICAWDYKNDANEMPELARVKYLHELQNWYYWNNHKQPLTINL